MVRQAAFDPYDSRIILTTSEDGLACLWKVTDGDNVADRKVIRRDNGTAILSALFVDGGNLIATTADDGSTELHDSRSGLQVAAMPGHREAVLAATFEPKHRLLATASADRTVRLWPIPPDGQTLIEEARHRVTRPLSAAERERFFLPPQ